MKRFIHFLLFSVVAAGLLLLSGCKKDEKGIEVDDPVYSTLIIGKWQVESSQEYWRYKSDGTGVTWDESDDVFEDEATTGRFKWTLEGDQVKHVFTGDEVNQAVPEYYTVKELTSSIFRRIDEMGNTVTLHKVQ